jgi:hypothetical protein
VPDFYIERAFATPLTTADERALSRRFESCARAYPVRWHECLVDGERTWILCHLEAENLPAARAAALCFGVKRDATWLSAVSWAAATRVGAATPGTYGPNVPTTAVTNGALVDVMAEWRFEAPTDAVRFAREQNVCDWCLDALRVQLGSVAMSADRRRVVAFFRAPDAEAVRSAYRYATVPFDRVIALSRLERQVA